MAIEIAKLKLGKRGVKIDPRTLLMSKYLPKIALPSVPPVRYWQKAVPSWPMMLNDQLGDCAIAAPGHAIQGWTANAGTMFTPSDAQIQLAYEAVGGYVPGDPSTDTGCVLLDVVNYWRKNGIANQKIAAFGNLTLATPNNPWTTLNPWLEMIQTIDIFGGALIGLQLPVSAQAQIDQGEWSVPGSGPINDGSPGTWGGHAVWGIAYHKYGVICVTWGQLLLMSWNFMATYADECYACLSSDWVENPKKVAPSGFNWGQMQADMHAIAA